MRHFFFLTLSVFVLLLKGSNADPNQRTLKVNLHYTGTVTVDEKHKVFVLLFNSPDFMQGEGKPVEIHAASAKDETLTFSDLKDSPVYAAVVLDPSGQYGGWSQPPSGSSTAIYAKNPDVPEPVTIEPGGTVDISIAFDDLHKIR